MAREKEDIAVLKTDIKYIREDQKRILDLLEKREAEFDTLRNGQAELKEGQSMLKWAIGLSFAILGTAIALIKLF